MGPDRKSILPGHYAPGLRTPAPIRLSSGSPTKRWDAMAAWWLPQRRLGGARLWWRGNVSSCRCRSMRYSSLKVPSKGFADAPSRPEGNRRGGSKFPVEIGLSAAIVSVDREQPQVLVVRHAKSADALPFGPFEPLRHRTLESGLRTWVKEQTRLEFEYAEQLYTFGDRGRHLLGPSEGPRVVSVGYLALTRATGEFRTPDAFWGDWYRYFPWEDWRGEKPHIIDRAIVPALKNFVRADRAFSEQRRTRLRICFGLDGLNWDEERVRRCSDRQSTRL